jgi:hypothetical protein
MEINHICGLGSLCHTAVFIKRNKFRTCAYPFDWAFSNPDIIQKCLQDDFNTFLNKSL